MVNHEILEGLRHALERGSTLEDAMLSFWRSGYKTEEIEDAAKTLVSHPSQEMSHPDKEIPGELKKPIGRPGLRELPEAVDLIHYKPVAKPVQHTRPVQPAPGDKKQQAVVSAMPKKAENPPVQPTQPKPTPPAQPATAAAMAMAKKPEPTPEERKQLVSRYGEKTKPKSKVGVVILIIILVLLVGVLAGIIIFKDELIQFFNNLFS